jgi:MFS family permease
LIIHFSGLLATAIIKMEGVGGLAGWRWIFILEGLATIISSIIAALTLPAGIPSAKFLTEEERSFACMFCPFFPFKLGHRYADQL